jgi:hypothetical protein
MNNAWGVASPPQERLNAQVAQTNAIIPIVQKILSGEKVEGITPKLAQQLMNAFKPDDLINLQDRGWDINPNWYQNYFNPGMVNPETYNAIMRYSGSFWNRDDLPSQWLESGNVPWQPWTEQSPYNLAMQGQPTYRQQLMQNSYDRARMGMQGQLLDPVAGEWRYDPGIALAAFLDQVGDLGVEQSIQDNPEARHWLLEWLGVGSEKAPKGTTSQMALNNTDSTLPTFSRPEVDAVRTAFGQQPLYSQGGLTLQPQNKTLDPKTNIEASVVGIPPEWYAEIKQLVTEVVNANPQNYERVVDTLKARGVPVEKFEALGWWKDLKQRAGR